MGKVLKGLFQAVPKEPSHETKETTNDPEIGGATLPPISFRYMKVFSPAQIEEIADQQAMSPQQLEDTVRANACWYRFFLLDNLFAISLDLATTSYQILRGRDGIQGSVHLLDDSVSPSNTVGLAISTPLALLHSSYKLATVSAKQEAVKRTLNQDSQQEIIDEWLTLCHDEPLKAAGQAALGVFNTLVQGTHGLLYGATAVLGFYEPVQCTLPLGAELNLPAPLPLLPWGAQIGIMVGTSYAGFRYCSLSSDYHQHVHGFFLSNEGPSLSEELSRGQYSQPLQILLRGVGSIVLTRAYPRFYQIAEDAFRELWGVDPETRSILAACATLLVGWQVFCSEYPKSYRRYYGDRIQIEALLKKRLDAQIGSRLTAMIQLETTRLYLSLPSAEVKEQQADLKTRLLNEFVQTHYQLYQDEVQAQANPPLHIQVLQNKSVKTGLVLQGVLGLYFGANVLAPAMTDRDEPSLSLLLLVVLTVSSLLSYTYYQAEKQKILDQLVLKKLLPPSEEKTAENNSRIGSLSAGLLIVGSQLSQALAVLGAGKQVFGDKHPLAFSATVFFVAENLLESLLLRYRSAQDSLSRLSCCRRKKPASPGSTPAALFSVNRVNIVPERAAASPSLASSVWSRLTGRR